MYLSLLLVLLCLYPGQAYGHGLGYTITTGYNLPCFTFSYSTGEKVIFAQVKVFSLAKNKLLAEGKTDWQGRFALPPFKQKVKIVLNAGFGHKKIIIYSPQANVKSKTTQTIIYQPVNWLSILTGLSILLNFVLFALFWKRQG